MQEQNLIMGLWKFSEKISKDELVELAQKWAEEDKNYLQLYVRKASKDQNGIGFTYKVVSSDIREAHDEYFEKTSDYLKKKFGNDLAGWDISSPVIIIK